MLSLIYVSSANPGFTEPQLLELAQASARRNKARNVTGLLAFNSRNFMQLLEGDIDDVLEIMRRIEGDTRHGNITFIRKDQRDRRECPEWSMRPIITPLDGLGPAGTSSNSLPQTLELDTQVIFSSFSSSLTAADAARSPQPR